MDHGLPASAKVIWMVLGLHAESRVASLSLRTLAAECSLAMSTVQLGLSRLEGKGWIARLKPGQWKLRTSTNERRQRYAYITGRVLHDSRLTTQARVLYATLQLMPGFAATTGQFTHPELSDLTGHSPRTVRRATRVLASAGWLVLEGSRYSYACTLRRPEIPQYQEVARARRRLKRAPFRGEGLTKELAKVVVNRDDYVENAKPGWLINPFTGELMHLDLYYPPDVAIEFNGPQHYRPTELYPDEEDFIRQMGRDAMKRAICQLHGIHLIVIHVEDLTVEGIRKRVMDFLPLRDLTDHQLLVEFLEAKAQTHIREAQISTF